VEIEETFAEAFTSTYARLLVTALNQKWALTSATVATGYGTSMIGCSAEAGIEGFRPPEETPDGRPGYALQIWTTKKKMKGELIGRISQCLLTAPTTAVWNLCPSEERLDIGHKMRFFGDGFEETREMFGRQVTVIPVMMGEFLIEKEFGIQKGVAGGNFLILAESQEAALAAAENAVEALGGVEGVIAPFPGGVCGAGSKVGSKKYSFMHATTNERYCPTLFEKVSDSRVRGIGAVSEVVIDGVSEEAVREAMRVGIEAATRVRGVKRISAGNYGGTLGDVHIPLHDLV
jgi:formylmethanofuran--tetrahydromethanopterin N-formyltransferase